MNSVVMSSTQFPHIFHDFVKNPSVENAKRVANCFTENDVRKISFMGQEDFVLTSLLTAITEVNVRNKNEVITHLIEALATFISFSRIKKLVSMQTTLMILIKQIGIGPEFVTVQPNLSEELKLAVMKSIAATFRRLLSDVIEQFYTKTNLRLIANALCISECIVSNETHRSLRIAGIEAILSIHQLHNEADENDIVLRQQIANLMFILSPKLIRTISDIATGEETLGEMLIARSITAFGQMLCLIFEEQDNDECYLSILEQTKILVTNSLKNTPKHPLNFDVLKLPKHSSSVDETIRQFEIKERTDEWLAAAAQKINPIIQRLHKLTGCKSNQIRQKLYHLSNLLLQRCQKHLNACVPALLEINITLYCEMAQQSELVFNENIVDIVEQLFVDHLMRLIRVTHTGDEEEQMANILLLRGFISILSKAKRLQITLSNATILENFIIVLLSLVELDRPMKLLEENNNIYDLTEKRAENVHSLVRLRDNTPWKSFQNLRNAKLINEIASICECLSLNDTVHIFILEYLLELLTKNSINCNEALVIVQMVVNSIDKDGSSESLHIVILEELLHEFRWYLATDISEASKPESSNRTWYEDRVEGLYESATIITLSDIDRASINATNNDDQIITIKDIKNNILHMCLTIETVGLYAKRLGKRYQTYMLRSFHRLLEKSASVHYMIRIAALIALNNVKEAFGLNTISQLIFDNADYVTYSINIYLKKSDQIDVALRMLSIVLHYSSIESMPHLQNIIETIVMESAKLGQSKNILSFMRAFSLILSTIRESMGKVSTSVNDVNMRPAISNNYSEVWHSILRGTDVTEEEMDTIAPNDVENNEGPMEAIEECEIEKSQKPPLVELSINVIKQSIPHFASKNQDIKLAALDCLNYGLDIVKDYDDDLLPIVHSIWDPFVHQCTRDTSPVVLRYCIRLLHKLALYARDFIYKRTADELLPHINSQMTALSMKCTAEKKQVLYEHTQEFKLIRELLISIPDILKNIDVQEKQFDDTLNAVIWLLDKHQPQSLQTHCVNFLKECAKFNICAVHLKLLKYYDNDRYKINCKKVFPNQFE